MQRPNGKEMTQCEYKHSHEANTAKSTAKLLIIFGPYLLCVTFRWYINMKCAYWKCRYEHSTAMVWLSLATMRAHTHIFRFRSIERFYGRCTLSPDRTLAYLFRFDRDFSNKNQMDMNYYNSLNEYLTSDSTQCAHPLLIYFVSLVDDLMDDD